MKATNVLLLGAVVTAFSFTSFAAEPVLSPRAQDNQIKIVSSSVQTPTTTIAYVSANTALLSPRDRGNQIKVVSGVSNDVNPALACAKTMIGSPKAVAECNSHTTMPGCVTVAPLK